MASTVPSPADSGRPALAPAGLHLPGMLRRQLCGPHAAVLPPRLVSQEEEVARLTALVAELRRQVRVLLQAHFDRAYPRDHADRETQRQRYMSNWNIELLP